MSASQLLLFGVTWTWLKPLWLVVVIFARDIFILLGAMLLRWFTSARQFPPSVWGKASTFLQMLTAGAWMTRDAIPGWFSDAFARLVIWPLVRDPVAPSPQVARADDSSQIGS